MTTPHGPVDHVQPPAASPEAKERSNAQLLGDIVGDLQTMVRKEIELAKHELAEAATVRAQAAAALVVAGIAGFLGLVLGAITAAIALTYVLPAWAAWLLVTGVLLAVAGIAVVVARSRAKAVPLEPEKTRRSIEENVRWAKTRLRR